MNRARLYTKASLFLLVTVALFPFYLFILILFYKWRRGIGPRLVQFYSRICLAIFHVRIDRIANYRTFKKKRKGILIISNHASFLDIFVLSALFGTLFVSKSEVKYYPIIGQIAWLAGVIFFDRGSSRERLRVLRAIAYNYYDRVLTVFPQGTTGSMGDRLPFQRGIFKVTELNRGIVILPVTLRYRKDEEIAWSRPQSLRENSASVLAQRRIHVTVTVHDPVTIDDYRGKTTDRICRMVEETVLGSSGKKHQPAFSSKPS